MLITTLKTLFNRDLKRLLNEIEQYGNETDIWKIKGQINNSAGNLCLHFVCKSKNKIVLCFSKF